MTMMMMMMTTDECGDNAGQQDGNNAGKDLNVSWIHQGLHGMQHAVLPFASPQALTFYKLSSPDMAGGVGHISVGLLAE